MRSVAEIRFRLSQELGNLRLLLGRARRQATFIDRLPPPPNLAGSEYAGSIISLAESICAHRFPLLGQRIETGPEIRWRRDYIRGIESGLEYFRRIPYLNAGAVGDHKIIWELNRHQHLIALAQAWCLTGRRQFLDEIPRQIEGWWKQNPFMRGINWASALEVAFRALSWIWVLHLCSDELPADFRQRLGGSIVEHGACLENNLSVYFSPNTHLLGEAVALHAIGAMFPHDPRSARWCRRAAGIVAAEMLNQVREDGSHFEQSSAYHVYALDFFLFHALLEDAPEPYRAKLRKMADYLAALSSDDGCISLLGDDDGGSLFHPYGDQRRFAARTLASCCAFFGADNWPCQPADLAVQAAWWMGERAFRERSRGSGRNAGPRLFADAGVVLLSKAPAHVLVDTRAFGHAGAGHSHAHALSIVCRYKGHDVLIDPGTYTYTAEPEWRTRFRGTAFHNTVRIDEADQANQAGPFRWQNKPGTEIIRWSAKNDFCYLHAACTCRDIRHERHFVWLTASEALVVIDVVKSASGGRHVIEQFWHCGEEVTELSPHIWRVGESSALATTASGPARIESGGSYGWRSETPGSKMQSPVIIVEQTTILPAVLGTVLFLRASDAREITLEVIAARIILHAGEGKSVEFREDGDPAVQWPETLAR